MSRLLSLKHAGWLAAAALLAFSQMSSAAPIVCGLNSTYDATANGAYADDCDFTPSNIASDGAVLTHTNSLWGGMDGDFTYVGRYEKDGGISLPGDDGFMLTVGSGSGDFEFSYQLVVPETWVGTKVDWVLGIKEANDSYMSYLFKDVTLGIDGGFNNFRLAPGGGPNGPNINNDYSFVAGFIREVATVPEAGTFLLMLTGLLGLGFARRQTRQSA